MSGRLINLIGQRISIRMVGFITCRVRLQGKLHAGGTISQRVGLVYSTFKVIVGMEFGITGFLPQIVRWGGQNSLFLISLHFLFYRFANI
jgi:hypothetical protein